MRPVRWSAVVVGGFLMLSGALAMAQQAAAPTKIAFVDVEKAVFEIGEGQARFKELQAWAKPRNEELQKLGEEIQRLQQEIQSKRGVANDANLQELNRQLVARQREFEDRQRNAKRDYEQKQSVVLKEIGDKMNKIVSTLAQKDGYTAVFILKPNDVIYLAPASDVTEQVVKIYNDTYPVAAAKSAPAK